MRGRLNTHFSGMLRRSNIVEKPSVFIERSWIRSQRTTQVIREVLGRLRSKNAPKHVEILFVVPKGPRLKSSAVMLYDCEYATSQNRPITSRGRDENETDYAAESQADVHRSVARIRVIACQVVISENAEKDEPDEP